MIVQNTTLPKVSILIPTYNRENLIGECIESALNQTFTDIEVIVVDNASTDKTWEICQDYAVLNPRLRIFRNEINIGPVRNWLRCVEEASGDYVKFLFSDDLMEPEYLSKTVPLLFDPTVAFVFSSVLLGQVPGEGNVAYILDGPPVQPIREYISLLKFGKVPLSPGAALFRTGDVRRNLREEFQTAIPRDFCRYGAGPDILLYALTALDYSTFASIADPLVFFRSHAQSITISCNNQITDGYRAALAWFFVRFCSVPDWRDYIAWQWLAEIKYNSSIINLRRLAIKFEGTGSLSEMFQIGFHVMRLSCSVVWRELSLSLRHKNIQ